MRSTIRDMTAETAAGRVKLLRVALGLTQEALAQASEGAIDRVVVVQIETGKNQATSYAIRAGLAVGFDVPVEALADYLDGKLPSRGLLALRGMRAASQWWRPIAAAAAHAPPASEARPVAQRNLTPASGTEIPGKHRARK
jgi:transcriptional regulator with XRE-family HTH domain